MEEVLTRVHNLMIRNVGAENIPKGIIGLHDLFNRIKHELPLKMLDEMLSAGLISQKASLTSDGLSALQRFIKTRDRRL